MKRMAAGALLFLLLGSTGLVACDQSKPESKAQASSGMVEVSAQGSEFDPPVEKSQVPAGAWICDMGTVHYAVTEKGKGVCPLCGMDLVQVGTEPAHDHE